MPHTAHEKRRAIARLRRIKGQAEALERAVQAGTDCSKLLQQVSALRGAANSLMAEVLESHLRETFAFEALPGVNKPKRSRKTTAKSQTSGPDAHAQIDRTVRMVRAYFK